MHAKAMRKWERIELMNEGRRMKDNVAELKFHFMNGSGFIFLAYMVSGNSMLYV